MTELISNFSFLAPSIHDCNFFATLVGKNWSLKGSSWEAGRNAYSFITVSVSPPKNSMYSPANECKTYLLHDYYMRRRRNEGRKSIGLEEKKMRVQEGIKMQKGLLRDEENKER